MRFTIFHYTIIFSIFSNVLFAQQTDQSSEPDHWHQNIEEIEIRSSADGSMQPAYFYKSIGERSSPLIVSLHTWSGDYRQEDTLSLLCLEQNYNYIHPDFRGVNNKPEACGSEFVISDIDDAIQYAIDHANVDIEEAKRRSPYFMQIPDTLRSGSQLSIYCGIHDGYAGSVPITQSLYFYNKVVKSWGPLNYNALVPRETIEILLRQRNYGSHQSGLRLFDRDIVYTNHLEDKVKLVVFEGSHEMPKGIC